MAESVTEGSLLDLIPAMIYWKDAQLVTVGANRVLLEDHGVLDPGSLQGDRLLHGLTRTFDVMALETGLPVLEREISSSHRTLSLSILPRRNARGDVTGIVGTCFDITESSSYREQLRRRRDFLAGLVEALPVGFFAKDPSSDFSYRIWNRKMEEIFGHSTHRAVDSRDWQLFGAEAAERITVHDREVLDSPEAGRKPRVYRLNCPSGQRTVSVVRVPLYDDLLDTTLVAGVVDDITRENQLKEQLRQAQKMEAVGRLAGGVAHDFNNLLQVIMGAAEMGSLATDGSREFFDQVLLAGEKAMSLTRQLLSFSRTESFSRKPFEVDARVGDFTAMVHRIVEASISLEFIPGAGGAVVNGDPFQLEQVLMNLIVNARDALEGVEGGRITVSTSVSEAVCSAGTESVSCAEISVSDNGPGVPEDVQNRIFEPFFTTKAQGRGTGLGLASSYAIVVKHGGTIMLESSPGEGSTFRVFLPIWEGQAGEDMNGIPHRKVQPAESGLTILLAEDEEMVREIVKAMLERAGHRVLEAPNGRRALEVFRANHESIDLAIFDAMMPEMNGRDAYEAILETEPDLPCIFCTGYSGESILGHFQGRARVRVLQKPCSASELLAAAGDLTGKNIILGPMPDIMRHIDGNTVTEAVASLYSRACTEPDPAVEALLAAALQVEPPGPGRDALELELENFMAAGRSGLPICQDTGTAVVFIEMGHLTAIAGGPLDELVDRGIAEAAERSFLRPSQVADPLCSRTNTGDNTPAVIHLRQVHGTGFRISVMAKGAGCENVSRSAMLPPLSGEEGLLSLAESCVRSGASRACPPLFLGIGAGGTLEFSGILAKRALLRKAGDPNPVEYLSTLEQRITERLNRLGIGPQGFGGRCTVLETRILTAPCHMASLPVTVCVECHAHRTASCEI